MSEYINYPAVDGDLNFPPEIRQKLADSDEIKGSYARSELPTAVILGDSRLAEGGPVPVGDASFDIPNSATGFSIVDWGQFFAQGGPRFRIIKNVAKGGMTTAAIRDRFISHVAPLSPTPSVLILNGGANDGMSTVAIADIALTNIFDTITRARALGMRVLLIGEYTSAVSTFGANYAAVVQYYNNKLRAYALRNKGIVFADINEVIIDPLTTTGVPKVGMMRDSIQLHFSYKGAAIVGKRVIATAIESLGFPPIVRLVNSVTDSLFARVEVLNRANNPLMQGSGGTKNNGITGTLPDGWVAASTGSPTAAVSTPPRADGFGNDLKTILTSTAGGVIVMYSALQQSKFVAGQTYVIEQSIAIDEATNLYQIAPYVRLDMPGGNKNFGPLSAPIAPATGVVDSLSVGEFIVRHEFTVPETPTNATLNLVLAFNGPGSATVRAGRVSVRPLIP